MVHRRRRGCFHPFAIGFFHVHSDDDGYRKRITFTTDITRTLNEYETLPLLLLERTLVGGAGFAHVEHGQRTKQKIQFRNIRDIAMHS